MPATSDRRSEVSDLLRSWTAAGPRGVAAGGAADLIAWVTDDLRRRWESRVEDLDHPASGLLAAVLDLRAEEETRRRDLGGHET